METKIVLITGASTGIGLSAAEQLMNKGVKVYAASRRGGVAQKSLSGSGEIIHVKMDVNDETTIGQLVFSTHESNLIDLEIFRQDEIWFAEKDKASGSTQLYSLSDYKPRYDLDIRKGYLQGRFGAIPFLDDLKNLNWHIKENA